MKHRGVVLVQHTTDLHQAQTKFSSQPIVNLEPTIDELLALGLASHIYECHAMLYENLSDHIPSRLPTGEALHQERCLPKELVLSVDLGPDLIQHGAESNLFFRLLWC